MRALFSTSYLFVTMILGAIALAITAVTAPPLLDGMMTVAEGVRGYIVSLGFLPADLNIWLKFLLSEQQLVFLFFVIMVRIAISVVESLIRWLIRPID